MPLYHESREVDYYDDIFKREIKQRKKTFSGVEKEKYEDGMDILSKGFPFQLAIAYQNMKDNFRRFFLEKNIKFYKPAEIDRN